RSNWMATLVSRAILTWSQTLHVRALVNNLVDNNSLFPAQNLLVFAQFIERTGTAGGRRKNDVERSEDNPRQLGKGGVRLVGSTPRRPGRKARKLEAQFTSSSGGVRAPSQRE